jgi:glycosyltransferase involved in cell wall biosynthesis
VTRPRTVITVNTGDAGGGAERVGREMHAAYAAAGEDAWLAVGRRRGDGAHTVELAHRARRSAWARGWMAAADALPQRGAGFWAARALREVVAEPMRWLRTREGREDFDFPATTSLLTLAGRAPDVLHLHNLHGGYFDLRTLPALSARVPTLVSLHDAWLLSGHCAHGFDCGRWEHGCGHCPALWIYPPMPRDATAENWQVKRAIYAESALHIGVPCAWLADRVRRSMLAPAVRELRVIPYGVDLDVWTPPASRGAVRAELGLDPARPVFLTHATSLQDRSWKDTDQFRGALARVGPAAAAAQWVAVGRTAPDERIGDVTVRFIGPDPDDRRFARWYQAADAYIHPAKADTFPLMVLEALACGTPVIGTAVGGIPEQLRGLALAGAVASTGSEPSTGALVPGGDAAALAATIDAFLALDPDRRHAMGFASRADAAARFDSHRHESDYLTWMRALAASPRPSDAPPAARPTR